jgi:DNA-binding MarR family transcriptional regulator
MVEPRWLDESEARAWRGYRRLRTLLDLEISRDLARDSGLSDPDYDVLSNLSETESCRLRLTELATHMRWSPSRTSHHIARMEQRGLVRREETPDDGRGAVVVLTDAGWKAIEAAAPLHVESVRRHLIDVLSPKQIAALGDIAESVIAHFAATESARHGRNG